MIRLGPQFYSRITTWLPSIFNAQRAKRPSLGIYIFSHASPLSLSHRTNITEICLISGTEVVTSVPVSLTSNPAHGSLWGSRVLDLRCVISTGLYISHHSDYSGYIGHTPMVRIENDRSLSAGVFLAGSMPNTTQGLRERNSSIASRCRV